MIAGFNMARRYAPWLPQEWRTLEILAKLYLV